MKRNTANKVLLLLITALIILAFSVAISVILMEKYQNKLKSIPVFNRVRIEVNPAMEYISKNYSGVSNEQEFYSKLKPELKKINSSLKIINLKGTIVYDSENQNSEKLQNDGNIEQLIHYDTDFETVNPGLIKIAFPITVEGYQVGNAVFVLPSKDLFISTESDFISPYIPLMIGIAIIIIILLWLYLILRKDVLLPVRSLNRLIPEMTKGNFDFKLVSFEKSEMGEFIRAFDLMGCELKYSLDRKDKLERERKELVASISHDIKTPLSSIKAYAEGLRDGIADSPETVEKYINVIISKTDGLVKLVNDLLQHSLQDLGNLKINLQERYARGLILSIIEPLQLKMMKTSVSLEIDGEVPDILLRVDSDRIEQVIVNLINNAEKYALDRGKIIVKAEVEDDCLLISVRDDGRGIPPEELPFIFDSFYRGKKSIKAQIQGAGLGLSICKYIIEKHGGVIFAESTPNSGSIFKFTLPKI